MKNLSNLSIFLEMGLIEFTPDTNKKLEERINFLLSGHHNIFSIPLRDKIGKMAVVDPPLYNPSYFGKLGEVGRDYRGKLCFFSPNGAKFPYLILSMDKRALITLEKRRTTEGKIDPRIQDANETVEELQDFLEVFGIKDVEVLETPTSIELKPKDWDKSIPAAEAIRRVAKERNTSIEKIAAKTIVLGDSPSDRAMCRPRGLDLKNDLPFVQIEGEDHTYQVLQNILRGKN